MARRDARTAPEAVPDHTRDRAPGVPRARPAEPGFALPSQPGGAVEPGDRQPGPRGRQRLHRRHRRPISVRAELRRHGLFVAVAVAGLAGRLLVVTTYRPGLVYLGDSAYYAEQAWRDLQPGGWRPVGYSMFLRLIDGHADLTRLVVVQHGLTFLVAVALYAVAVRATGRPWLAALVAGPAMLSSWVLDLGQFLLADSLFTSMVTAGAVLLARPGRPSFAAVVGGGVLLGASVVVRTAGYGPLAVGGVVLAVAVWRGAARLTTSVWGALARVLAFGLAAAAPLVGYATWSVNDGGRFAVSAHSGFFLYGRVAPFADCSVLSREDLRTLCDPRPVAERPQPDVYLWDDAAPLRQGDDHVPAGREELAGEFAAEVVRAQPWTVVRTTASYLVGYLSPTRHEDVKTSRAATWELPDQYTNVLPKHDPHHFDGYYVVTTLDTDVARYLAEYSRWTYAPMPLVGAGLVAGLLAAVLAALRRRPGPPRLFWLAAGSGTSVLTIGALTAGFDYRYLASVVGLWGAAAVVGFSSLVGATRRGASGGLAARAAER